MKLHVSRRSLCLFALVLPLVLGLEACSRNRSGPEYGPMQQRRTASNVITAEDISRYPMASTVEELIVRLVPGVQVTRSQDGTLALHIMGLTSGSTSGGALTVIDGVPLSNNGSIGLNPRDVHRIEVLRDGGSTALYGFRGANGVILITTKTQQF